MEKRLDLQILCEKALHHAVDSTLISYCPSMDLIALVTTDQQVFIYRMNGQRVYGASQKARDLRVESICWKPNGLNHDCHSGIEELKFTQGSFSQSPGAMGPFGLLVLRVAKLYINSPPLKDHLASRAWDGQRISQTEHPAL